MKKLLIVGGAVTGVAGAAFLAKRFASSSGGPDFERWIERMPDNAPPKWIFRNVTAIRENTERILQLLESEERRSGGS
jgi:cyanophycinase-like exopeptidase